MIEYRNLMYPVNGFLISGTHPKGNAIPQSRKSLISKTMSRRVLTDTLEIF